MSAEKTKVPPKHADRAPAKKGQELDEALEGTFPASDPVTVGEETGDEPPHASKERRTPPLDENLVKKLARELKQARKDN